MTLLGGDVQAAYNYLVELVRRKQCLEATVWVLMDDLIFRIIPPKPCCKEAAA